MKTNHIKTKMISIILITLIPLLILKTVEIQEGFESSVEVELEASQDFAEAVNTAFMNFLERTWSSQHAIGNVIIANPSWDNEDIEKYLSIVALGDKKLRTYYWSDPRGVIISSLNHIAVNEDLSERKFVKEIIDGKEMVIGNLEPSIIDGELIIPIARGIKADNELKGIVINTIKANDMKDIVPIDRIGTGSIFGLVDRNAVLVYRHGNENMTMEERNVSEDSTIRKALKGEIVKTYSRYSEFDGKKRIGIDFPIKDIGWSVFVTTLVEKPFVSGKRAFIKELIIYIIICISSFAMAIGISSGFIKSINKLKEAANKVMHGDLDVKTDIGEGDDFYDVGQAFDSMIEGLNKIAREEEKCNSLKFQFLSNVSHELKTPLNIILGCTQILESLDMENQQEFQKIFKKYNKMQKQNSYRLLRLINNLIDVNKIESNYINIELSNGDIIKTIEDITMSIVEYTKLKDISIIFDTDMEERITAFDVDMMERIILNLLSNAIKFTEKGGKIQVNISNGEEEIIISIKDSGIGIPEDKLNIIFGQFTQIDNSLRRKTEGSGIGLFLVKSLVELHGGNISVQSVYGEGTEFIIVLPYKIVENDSMIREEGISNVERIYIEFSDIYI